jgi:putative ABC transport system ATP-binding protein
MSAAVECCALTKGFDTPSGRVEVLRCIDFAVEDGEMVIIEGPSGSGKTTLLSIIGGLELADSGVCRLKGTDLAALKPGELAVFRSRRVGFVFQQFYLLPFLSVESNVALPLKILGVSRSEAMLKAHRFLEAVEMEKYCKMKPLALSGGQQQRVAIARALVHGPETVICDEPTSALDTVTAKAVVNLIKTLSREENTTVLVVTHDSRLFSYADRVLRIENGCIQARQDLTGKFDFTHFNLQAEIQYEEST